MADITKEFTFTHYGFDVVIDKVRHIFEELHAKFSDVSLVMMDCHFTAAFASRCNSHYSIAQQP